MGLTEDTFSPESSAIWISPPVPNGWQIDVRRAGSLMQDHFDPEKSMWATRLPSGEAQGEQLEELARIRLLKFPAEPAEAFAAHAQDLRAMLAGMIGHQAAARFLDSSELGAEIVLRLCRHGWLYACPGAAQEEDQLFRLGRAEGPPDVEV